MDLSTKSGCKSPRKRNTYHVNRLCGNTAHKAPVIKDAPASPSRTAKKPPAMIAELSVWHRNIFKINCERCFVVVKGTKHHLNDNNSTIQKARASILICLIFANKSRVVTTNVDITETQQVSFHSSQNQVGLKYHLIPASYCMKWPIHPCLSGCN